MKLLIADIGADLHKRLKDHCYNNDMKMKDVVSIAIRIWLDKCDKEKK